jgi:hypothetical protein
MVLFHESLAVRDGYSVVFQNLASRKSRMEKELRAPTLYFVVPCLENPMKPPWKILGILTTILL